MCVGLSCLLMCGPAFPSGTPLQDEDGELEALLEEERAEADRLRRRGSFSGALEILREHLREEPEDAASRIIRAACRLDQSDWE